MALREDAVSAPVRREPTRTAAAQQATPRDDIPNHPTTLTRRWMITTSVVLGSTLYSTTLLIASTLLPQIQGAISTQDEVAWVMTFNILATAVVTPTTGWLVARLGRRRVMAGSMLLSGHFSISACCSTAITRSASSSRTPGKMGTK